MAGVKLVVIYPRPKDIEVFEKLYQEEHVPMAVDKLAGKTKFIATKVVATPDGTTPPFYRIAEVYFPSLEALQAYASTITLSTIFDAGTITIEAKSEEMNMVAYIVFTRERTRNQAELDTYSQKAPASMPGHALTPRAFYGRLEVLEGAGVEGVAILEFPTFDEAKAWYDSPAYREVREHRYKGADYRVVIVQGV